MNVARLDEERLEFGLDYEDHGLLFCWDNGTPPHPDTITRRFGKLVESAELHRYGLMTAAQLRHRSP